uniref:Nondiscriminating glutamyl-tRNA synthetase EARS2, mitochondrial n=1 Tax=Hirondellea gigas TaxID=1518452 RepID=A0A2P2I0R1_9CRUS
MHVPRPVFSIWRAVRSRVKPLYCSHYHSTTVYNPTTTAKCCVAPRTYCTTAPEGEVRVRFAPSPTGYLHLGGLRTALYNYLLARSKNGKFILRIEDTDSTRLVPGAAEALYEMLQWAGLEPDESPVGGGSHGPYMQSERRHLYQQHASALVDNGAAYRCFCSKFRLELLRKENARQGERPKYDNKCSTLSTARADKLVQQGTPHCVRLKLRPTESFHDLVYGEICNTLEDVEGDPVILKSDGQATYHLANVVDDHLMGVTHVLRGVEWQVSTPKHILLYQGLGWTPPALAHLPLMLNTDGSKLSKRQDNLRVEHLRSAGYTARSLLNFVIGGGLVNKDNSCIYTLDDLVQKFDISRITTNPSRIDMERLDHLSRMDLHRSIQHQSEASNTRQQLRRLVQDTVCLKSDDPVLRDEFLSRVMDWSITEPINRLQDLMDPKFRYLWTAPTTTTSSTSDSSLEQQQQAVSVVRLVQRSVQAMSEEEYTRDGLLAMLKSTHETLGMKKPLFMKTVRLAMCGTTQGDAVVDIFRTFGRDEALRRLQCYLDLNKLQSDSTSNT